MGLEFVHARSVVKAIVSRDRKAFIARAIIEFSMMMVCGSNVARIRVFRFQQRDAWVVAAVHCQQFAQICDKRAFTELPVPPHQGPSPLPAHPHPASFLSTRALSRHSMLTKSICMESRST